MNENSPLASRPQVSPTIRQNLFQTYKQKIYTSYYLLAFTFVLTTAKILSGLVILSTQEINCSAPLCLWNIVLICIDSAHILLKVIQLPFIKRTRQGEVIQEYFLLKAALLIRIMCYTAWQLPGNYWYWTCEDCFNEAPALNVLTLANLIVGLAYLIIPMLIVLSICVCMPCAMLTLMFISGGERLPATDEMLGKLKDEEYDASKHFGESYCTICAVEYVKKDKIVVMNCDGRHFFHSECIKKWLAINSTCPICRAPYLVD